jgi:hypothetical protein
MANRHFRRISADLLFVTASRASGAGNALKTSEAERHFHFVTEIAPLSLFH